MTSAGQQLYPSPLSHSWQNRLLKTWWTCSHLSYEAWQIIQFCLQIWPCVQTRGISRRLISFILALSDTIHALVVIGYFIDDSFLMCAAVQHDGEELA